ncbi:hypothetical protein HMI56_004099 [Coelomomyces lativittatus]|nr:hypothetical protein HMI56_004099 [Coelomomyces lativittatus]
MTDPMPSSSYLGHHEVNDENMDVSMADATMLQFSSSTLSPVTSSWPTNTNQFSQLHSNEFHNPFINPFINPSISKASESTNTKTKPSSSTPLPSSSFPSVSTSSSTLTSTSALLSSSTSTSSSASPLSSSSSSATTTTTTTTSSSFTTSLPRFPSTPSPNSDASPSNPATQPFKTDSSNALVRKSDPQTTLASNKPSLVKRTSTQGTLLTNTLPKTAVSVNTTPSDTPTFCELDPATYNRLVSYPSKSLASICQRRGLPDPQYQLRSLPTSYLSTSNGLISSSTHDIMYGMSVRLDTTWYSVPLIYFTPQDAKQASALLGLHKLGYPVDIELVAKKLSFLNYTTLSQAPPPSSASPTNYWKELHQVIQSHQLPLPSFLHSHVSHYPARHVVTVNYMGKQFEVMQNRKNVAKEMCAKHVLDFLKEKMPDCFEPPKDFRDLLLKLTAERHWDPPMFFDPSPERPGKEVGVMLGPQVFLVEASVEDTLYSMTQKACKKAYEWCQTHESFSEVMDETCSTSPFTDPDEDLTYSTCGTRTHFLFEEVDQTMEDDPSKNTLTYQCHHYQFSSHEADEKMYLGEDEVIEGEEYLETEPTDTLNIEEQVDEEEEEEEEEEEVEDEEEEEEEEHGEAKEETHRRGPFFGSQYSYPPHPHAQTGHEEDLDPWYRVYDSYTDPNEEELQMNENEGELWNDEEETNPNEKVQTQLSNTHHETKVTECKSEMNYLN